MARNVPNDPASSPEFGTFISAPVSLMDDDEPLFLDTSHRPLQPQPHMGRNGNGSGSSRPIHVTLPPRPDEISDDFIFDHPQLQPQPQPSSHPPIDPQPTYRSSNPSASMSQPTSATYSAPRTRQTSFNGGIAESPPKLTQRRLSVRSPGSPAAVTDFGRDIVFHASSSGSSGRGGAVTRAGPGDGAGMSDDQGWWNSLTEKDPGSSSGPGTRATNGSSERKEKSEISHNDRTELGNTGRSPIQSRLLETIATTAKVANKWRHSIEHDFFDPPPVTTLPAPFQNQTRSQTSSSSSNVPSLSATGPSIGVGTGGLLSSTSPINVTHSSPFATGPQLAGSYVPPSGAPGFMPEEEPKRRDTAEPEVHVRLTGRRESTEGVLNGEMATCLHKHLPPRQRLSSTWTLSYSSDQHGASLGTLYRNIENRASRTQTGSVVIAMDGQGGVFGAFVNEPIRRREGQYYGSGESFLFKYNAQRDKLRIFRWTGKNQYFALCEGGFMSFGGGGTYGLLVDSTMTRGSSATCKTYDNEVLCTNEATFTEKAVRFDCVGLEVWMTS